MKAVKFLLMAMLLSLGSLTATAQQDNLGVIKAPSDEKGELYSHVPEMASFPGGDNALGKFLGDNVNYMIAKEKGVQGRVTVEFIVEVDGSLSNIHVLLGKEPSLDQEALRVVKKMPKWIPGKLNGEAVRVKILLPITFRYE